MNQPPSPKMGHLYRGSQARRAGIEVRGGREDGMPCKVQGESDVGADGWLWLMVILMKMGRRGFWREGHATETPPISSLSLLQTSSQYEFMELDWNMVAPFV